jgi:hypothetical protein
MTSAIYVESHIKVRYAECYYGTDYYAECLYAKCHGTEKLNKNIKRRFNIGI